MEKGKINAIILKGVISKENIMEDERKAAECKKGVTFIILQMVVIWWIIKNGNLMVKESRIMVIKYNREWKGYNNYCT